MTTRELLRAASDRLDCADGAEGDCDMEPPCSTYATALRTLASRLDAEMATLQGVRGIVERTALGLVNHAMLRLLARLDAPLDVDPNSTQQNQAGEPKP